MNTLKCLIIDDNELDMLMVTAYVKRFPIFEIIGVFDSAQACIESNLLETIDVIFSDIDMPKINGLSFRRNFLQIPVCVFITSHPEHALESFEVDTFDFLVKPLDFNRFEKTVQRIKNYFSIRNKASQFEESITQEEIYIKEGHHQIKVKLQDILYLEALKDYTLVVTSAKKHCVLCSLGNLIKGHHFQNFIRIHRSYAVQKNYIKRIETHDIHLSNDMLIPVGRSYKDNLKFML